MSSAVYLLTSLAAVNTPSGSMALSAGELLTDSSIIAAVKAAGGAVGASTNPAIAAAAKIVAFQRAKGQNEQALTQTMIVAALPAVLDPSALTIPFWWVDPSNVTGLASDSNTGTSNGAPLLTYAEIVRRWGTNAPILNQDTFIFPLSDPPDFSDPINIRPQCNACNLYLIGTPQVVATDVISAWTPLNRATGVDNRVAGTAITDFTPYAGMLMRIALTSFQTAPAVVGSPAVSFTGAPATVLEPLQVQIDFPGTLGVATFSWFVNGVLQAKNVVTAASVVLGATGATVNFPAATYATNHLYTTSSHCYGWITSEDGKYNPDTTQLGATISLSPTMAFGKQYGPNGLQWNGLAQRESFGINPPAATFRGIPQARYHHLRATIDGAGTLGVATFSWSINGVTQASGVLTAAAVSLGNTGVTFNPPVGTYTVGDSYAADPMAAVTGPDQGARPYMQTAQVAMGQSFTILKPTKIYAQALGTTTQAVEAFNQAASNAISLQDLWFVGPNTPPIGFPGQVILNLQGANPNHCRFDVRVYETPSNAFHAANNCCFVGGLNSSDFWIYGGHVGNDGPFMPALFAVAEGAVIDGDCIIVPTLFVLNRPVSIGSAHLKGSLIFARNNVAVTPTGQGVSYNAAQPGGATAVWGSGKVQAVSHSFDIVNVAPVTATNAFLLTGTPPVLLDGLSVTADDLVLTGSNVVGNGPTGAAGTISAWAANVQSYTGLTGTTPDDVGASLAVSGAATAGNNSATNGNFAILSADGAGNVTVLNPFGANTDANNGALAWTVKKTCAARGVPTGATAAMVAWLDAAAGAGGQASIANRRVHGGASIRLVGNNNQI